MDDTGNEENEINIAKEKSLALPVSYQNQYDSSCHSFNNQFTADLAIGIFSPRGLLGTLEDQTPSTAASLLKECNTTAPNHAQLDLKTVKKDTGTQTEADNFDVNASLTIYEARSVTVEIQPHSSSISPEKNVFAIDHILESIFVLLDRPALLKCRQVCHRWLYWSSKELEKVMTLEFSCSNRKVYHTFEDLEDFTTLMTNSITEFPCKSFSFRSYRTFNPYSQSFFTLHGHYLKSLKIVHSILFKDLQKLLFKQASNLENLIMEDVEVYSDSKSNPSFITRKLKAILKTKNEPPEKIPNSISCKLQLKQLKTLQVSENSCPENIVLEIMEFSPKLKEVHLVQKYLHLLIIPPADLNPFPNPKPNGLHLLQSLTISLDESAINLLELFANHHGGNWALRELNLINGHVLYNLPQLWTRATVVLGKVLEAISASCTRLNWWPVAGILKGLKIPIMPKLLELKLSFSYFIEFSSKDFIQYIPGGMSVQDKFPNLRSIELPDRLFKFCNVPSSIFVIFDVDKNFNRPVCSVTKVIFRGMLHRNNRKLLKSCQDMFPNATFL